MSTGFSNKNLHNPKFRSISRPSSNGLEILPDQLHIFFRKLKVDAILQEGTLPVSYTHLDVYKRQIQFDFLVSRLMSPRLQNIVRILTNIVIVLFFFLLLPPTMRLVQSMNTIPSAALSWPSGLPHLGYLAGLCAMIVAFLGDCMEAASELTRKGGAPI